MKITFIGAAHEVTGSCTYIEVGDKKGIVDYGMEQGRNLYENAPLPVAPGELDFVLLTHAHIDHSGMLPALYKQGFLGIRQRRDLPAVRHNAARLGEHPDAGGRVEIPQGHARGRRAGRAGIRP